MTVATRLPVMWLIEHWHWVVAWYTEIVMIHPVKTNTNFFFCLITRIDKNKRQIDGYTCTSNPGFTEHCCVCTHTYTYIYTQQKFRPTSVVCVYDMTHNVSKIVGWWLPCVLG